MMTVSKEPLYTSCRSLLHLLESENNDEIYQMMLNDLLHKFKMMNTSHEKNFVAIKAIKPLINNEFEPFYTHLDSSAKKKQMSTKKHFDVLILTVVPNEFIAFKKLFDLPDADDPDLEINGYRFWPFNIYNNSTNKELRCITTMIGQGTNEKAAVATTQALSCYDIDLAVMVGIAAGPQKEVNICDVVIASQVFDYENQKLVPGPSLQRPTPRILNSILLKQLDYFTSLINRKEFSELYQANVDELLDKAYTDNPSPKIKLAPILAGNKLLSDGYTLERLIRNYHDKARAAEMEANGFSLACDSNTTPWLIFRGISDHGDPNKPDMDDFQENSALSAILACKLFLERDYRPLKKEVQF